MKRRDFLTAIGTATAVSLSGCSTNSEQLTNSPRLVETSPPNQTTTYNNLFTNHSTATITSEDKIPLNYNASFIEPKQNQPPQVKITLTNPTETQLKFADSQKAFFWLSTEQTTPLRLYPHKTDLNREEYSSNPCWQRNKPVTRTEDLQAQTIDAGQSITKYTALAITPYTDCPVDLSPSLIFQSEIQIAKMNFTETGAFWSDITLTVT